MDLQRLLRPARVPELPEAEMLRESAEDDLLARIVEDAGGARAATGVQANSRVPYATAKALAENVLIDLFNNSATASAFADTYMSQASERAAAIDSLGKELAADFASAKCDAIGLAAAAARIKRTHSNALALALGSDAVVRGPDADVCGRRGRTDRWRSSRRRGDASKGGRTSGSGTARDQRHGGEGYSWESDAERR